jgi:Bacteriocin-protection, YdeI or OmpD-Associated/Domain of unknown function (DUF1905)
VVEARTFTATVEERARGGIAIRLPFDPGEAWGTRERYDVTGTVDEYRVRGRLRAVGGAHYLELGPSWCRDCRMAAGARVAVSLGPEGPQMDSMAPDFAAALDAEPEARRFFESLATFYRKNFVRWIEDARRAETRARRISETVATLKAGKRER